MSLMEMIRGKTASTSAYISPLHPAAALTTVDGSTRSATDSRIIQEQARSGTSTQVPKKESFQTLLRPRSVSPPVTSKTSKGSSFTEQDIRTLTRFLETQPLGVVPRSAFQEFAEREPRHSFQSWYGKYISEAKYFQKKTGRGWVAPRPSQSSAKGVKLARAAIEASLANGPAYGIVGTNKAAVTPASAQSSKSAPEAKKRRIDASHTIESMFFRPDTSASHGNSSSSGDNKSTSHPSSLLTIPEPTTTEDHHVDAMDITSIGLKSSSQPAQDVLKALGWVEEQVSDDKMPHITLRMKRVVPAENPSAMHYLEVGN